MSKGYLYQFLLTESTNKGILVTCTHCIKYHKIRNGKTLINYDFGKTWKDVAVACYEVLLRHLPEKAENDHKTFIHKRWCIIPFKLVHPKCEAEVLPTTP